MKFSSFLVAFAVTAVVANAQQPPVPPVPTTPPVPAKAPAAPAPVAAPTPPPARGGQARASGTTPLGGTRSINGLDRDYERYNDALARTDAAMARSDAAVARASAQTYGSAYNIDVDLAMEKAQRAMIDGRFAAQGAMRDAQDRLSEMRLNFAVEPLINSTVNAIASAGIGGGYSSNFSYSLPQGAAVARWQEEWKQDRDPADSLFNGARDALNRGEYRRSADLFAQVYTKYPKSTRLQQAAYYEAFSRYRIGSTDELKVALKVLNERAQGSSNTSNSNEVQILTTRVRGALAQRGDADAARQLQADAQKGKVCDTEDMQIRSEALSALAQSDMAAATPILRKQLERKDPCSLDLRRRALSILLRRADTAATSAAISVAKNTDETLELRTDAISYLARLPGDNALAALEDLLKNSTDRDIQRAAIRSLSNTDNVKARQTIRMVIDRTDVSEQLRVEALNSFERDRGTNADDAAFLRGLYPKLQSDALKRAAIAAISKNPGADNEQFVMAIARNPGESSDVRGNAISRMYRIPAISISDIGKLYDMADSRSMRAQIINVLSQRNEPETVDKLGDIAKTSTDPSMRTQAISALGRKADPRAKKMIVDLAAGTP